MASKVEERLLRAVAGAGGEVGAAISASRRTGLFDIAIVLVALWAMVVKLGV